MSAKKSDKSVAQVLQFKITLQDVTPEIWRRIQVPSNYTFWDLHVAIQDAMGWEDTHLHEFRIADPEGGEERRIGMPDDELLNDEDEDLTEPGWDVDIAAFFPSPRSSATYIYDFGDNWEHAVVLESMQPAEAGIDYPRCTGGERACPSEDCGGPISYSEMVEALLDPDHDEHASFREMVGPDFDPARFNPEDVAFEDPKARLEAALGDAADDDGEPELDQMDEPDPKALHATFRDVVSQQLRENDPPETQQTYDRLIEAGYSKDDVWRMLSAVVAAEMFEIVRTQRAHDQQQYVRWLENLPKLPYD